MEIFKNGIEVDNYTPSYGGKKIIIAIDSSKSNSALVVADVDGRILDDYEIRGGGESTDVLDLCKFTRTQLKELFFGSEILQVGIEDIITKKSKGYGGIEVHQSRYKITAVFDNFIFLFEEFFGVRPIKINNQEWKAAVLPEEYRKRDHKKGSLDWFNDMNNRWAGRSDDVCDAVCICTFLFKEKHVRPVYEVKNTEPTTYKYEYIVVPKDYPVSENLREFVILNNDNLEHNLCTITNKLQDKEVGYTKVPTRLLPIDVIYSDKLVINNGNMFDKNTDEVIVIIERN